MPFWFLPKEVGLKGAVYADAGSLWDYQGPTSWAATGEVNSPTCSTCGLQYDDSNIIRTSVGGDHKKRKPCALPTSLGVHAGR
jgi:outer membrane protein insertion porin family